MQITDKQNKGLFVFDTVFIRTIIWLTLSGLPDNGPDKDSIENKMPFILYLSPHLTYFELLHFHYEVSKGNNKITELREILQRESQYFCDHQFTSLSIVSFVTVSFPNF